CKKVEITQTYIIKDGAGCERIRRRGSDGSYVYFHTVKRDAGGIKRVEEESRISEEEYLELMKYADPSRKTIEKYRYCIVYKGQYLELDVFPFCDDCALIEAELLHEDDAVELPEYVKVIREVTGDKRYSNHTISARGLSR
ncbi:MAG: hypothetical protein IKN38_01990, partial [Clostridia bacterium]|nr:hypothetical protein [Clostridia bacterium]